MEEPPPSLTSLCINTLTQEFLFGDNVSLLEAVYDLPPHLLDDLIKNLPPVALKKFHHHMPFQDLDADGFSNNDSTNKRKRARDCDLDIAWRKLFGLRWPDLINKIQPTDWQNAYWETHLQNCLDAAAEIALITSFNGRIGDIQVSDSILKYIGFVGHPNNSTCIRSKLSYHCLQFGSHVSCLRLQNILCTEETCGLLRGCKLESLVLRCIRSKEQVDGLCMLIAQHSRTLTSLEFIHCTVYTDFINAIFDSLVIKGVKKHGIKHLSIVASSLEPWNVLPCGLVSFLSTARSLCSLKLSESHIGRPFAKALFTTLLEFSSSICTLDLSENGIAGWLSDFNRRFSKGKSLHSLRVLNLRGNNLKKADAESLRHALTCMPNLEDLDLSDNSIGDGGIRKLTPCFDGISETCSRVTCLKLESCELSFDGVNHLLRSLTTFKGPLKSLSVADNYLGRRVAEALGSFLSTPIEIVDIAGIGFGPSGFQEIQNFIKGELHLVKINISQNRGGIETARFLSKLLPHAPQLTDVNAASNIMPVESLSIISTALKCAKGNVRHLDLTGHTWDYKPEHVFLCSDFVNDEKPILILPKPLAVAAPYDNDP